jgi:tetratricopeptide (TPR) repeat protein
MNIKALIRRGRAKHKLQKYKEALIDFQEALKVEPDNGEIK